MDDRKYPVTGRIYGRHASRTRPHVAEYPRLCRRESSSRGISQRTNDLPLEKTKLVLPLEQARETERGENSSDAVYNCL